MIKKEVLAKIKGRVQGVGFRYFTAKQANSLGLSGYAKNLADGSVEVLAQGEELKLKQLISLLRLGPRSAEVSEVTTRWSALSRDYRGLDIC